MILGDALPLRNGGGGDAHGPGDPCHGHALAKNSIKDGVSAHVNMLSMAKNTHASDILSAANSRRFYPVFMEIGDRIKRERNRAGLTQPELADRVGVNKSAVAQWESPASRKGITAPNLIRVADALGVSVTRLTGEDEAEDRLELTLPEELKLVRLFRIMNARQQRVHLELFHTSVGLTHPEEPESHPSEGAGIVADRAVKQKT